MLQTTMERCLHTGVTTVTVTGELTLPGIAVVRSALDRAAAECPTAVIVDLSDFRHTAAAQLSVFATATYDAQYAWGVPVLLCDVSPELRRGLKAFRSFVAIFDHRFQAELAVRSYVPRWVRHRFPPVDTSAAATRGMVGEACLIWGLMHLRDTARLVASELAANAITHARTDFDVLAGYTGRYLRIAVRDSSSARPRPATGRGLQVIAAAGKQWGVMPLPDGKIVWVLMQAHHW